MTCKLADFGLCAKATDELELGGSFYYLSPILKKKHQNKKLQIKSNPFKDDVYSFGLTLYELIMKKTGDKRGDRKLHRISEEIYQSTES